MSKSEKWAPHHPAFIISMEENEGEEKSSGGCSSARSSGSPEHLDDTEVYWLSVSFHSPIPMAIEVHILQKM